MSIECIDSELFNTILRNQQEQDSKIDSLQKAIAAFRAQLEDFRTEQAEDVQDLKRRLWELQFIRRERA